VHRLRVLAIALLVLLTGCQAALPPLPSWQSPLGLTHADLGRIEDLRTGERLTPRQLVERLAKAPRVLVGEQHDNPDHHALQLWLLRALAVQRQQGSLLLEMLTPDQQPKVDAVRAQFAAGESLANLPRALAWQRGWNWALYEPLVRHALSQPYPLLAANLQRAEVLQVYRRPAVLHGTASTAQRVRQSLLEQIRVSHCGLLPDSQLPAMLAVQQQRDRRMAEALLAAPAPSLLVAGAFHVRRDLGVPLHLIDLQPLADSLVLLLAEVGQPVNTAAADFVWYSAALPEQDHCADLGP
jgi:uncharacterized iron-regulated protein